MKYHSFTRWDGSRDSSRYPNSNRLCDEGGKISLVWKRTERPLSKFSPPNMQRQIRFLRRNRFLSQKRAHPPSPESHAPPCDTSQYQLIAAQETTRRLHLLTKRQKVLSTLPLYTPPPPGASHVCDRTSITCTLNRGGVGYVEAFM